MGNSRAYRSYEEFAREELRETSGIWRLHEVMDDLLVGDELDKDLFEGWKSDADDDEDDDESDEKDEKDENDEKQDGDDYEGQPLADRTPPAARAA